MGATNIKIWGFEAEWLMLEFNDGSINGAQAPVIWLPNDSSSLPTCRFNYSNRKNGKQKSDGKKSAHGNNRAGGGGRRRRWRKRRQRRKKKENNKEAVRGHLGFESISGATCNNYCLIESADPEMILTHFISEIEVDSSSSSSSSSPTGPRGDFFFFVPHDEFRCLGRFFQDSLRILIRRHGNGIASWCVRLRPDATSQLEANESHLLCKSLSGLISKRFGNDAKSNLMAVE